MTKKANKTLFNNLKCMAVGQCCFIKKYIKALEFFKKEKEKNKSNE